jgi:predicted component of type VI protein secretion system
MQGSGSFRLIVRRGPQPNQVYELNKDSLTIGRDINNEIVINDPEVSRNHCRFTRGPGGYTLTDLGSTNGTFVNGQRLTGERPLGASDMIGLGETVTLGYESTMMPLSPAPTDLQQPSPGTVIAPRPQPGAANPYAPQAPVMGQQSPYAPPAQPGANAPQQGGAGQYPPPYAAPPGDYSNYAPPAPPPQYGYQEPQAPSGNPMARFIFLGCGCALLLCIVLAIIALVIIDSQNLYCKLPLLRNVVNIISPCPVS